MMRVKQPPRGSLFCLVLIAGFATQSARLIADDEWSEDWQATMLSAQSEVTPRPVIVKFEASWCAPCKVLAERLNQPEIVSLLSDWHRIRVDVDQPPAGVDVNEISALPTIRILSSSGETMLQHVGLMEVDELLAWLRVAQTQFDAARRQAEFARKLGIEEIDQEQTDVLLQMLAHRSPELRAAAAAVLIEYPTKFAEPVVDAFATGPLRTQLAALDVLQRWRAPLDGLSPWDPASLDEQSVGQLKQWGSSQVVAATSAPPSPQQIEEFDLELDRLVRRGQPREGLIASLALASPDILPRVRERLAHEVTDDARERLLTVRYRLVADPTLAFRLDNVPARLASNDISVRRAAAKELSDQAQTRDLDLLEALFGHNDAFVRELSLRGMQQAAGGQVARLTKLLGDPDKNVRATVLKVWLDDPDESVLEAASAYVARETDADLLVYVARLLKELQATTPAAIAAMSKLAEHEDWQVRAEVAAAISHIVTADRDVMFGADEEQPLPTAVREIGQRLLADKDAFVLSQIIPAMIEGDQADSFDRLLEIAWKYPEIRQDVLPHLKSSPGSDTKEFLITRWESKQPSDRVFAIDAMKHLQPDALDDVLPTALDDPEIEVRRAAVGALITWLDLYHADLSELPPELDDDLAYSGMVEDEMFAEVDYASANTGFLGALGSLFGSSEAGSAEPIATDDAEPVETAPAILQDAADDENALPAANDDPPAMTLEDLFGEPPGNAAVAEATPATSAETAAASTKYEHWLAQWRANERTDVPWLNQVADKLSKMNTQHGDPTGEITLVLARLGVPFQPGALIDAFELHGSESALSDLYPWLLREDRGQLFLAVAQHETADTQLPLLVTQARRYDAAMVTDWYWQALEVLPLSAIEHAYQLAQSLTLLTTGQEYYSPYAEDPAAASYTADLLQRFKKLQQPAGQMIALSVLSAIDPSTVPELVGVKYNDDSNDVSVRRDWARFALATRELDAAVELAKQWISDKDLQPVALSFLSRGYEGVSTTESGWISIGAGGEIPKSSGLLDVPVLPPGIDPELIRPLLQNDDEMIAGQATYLLLILGEDVDLQPLLIVADQEDVGSYVHPMTDLLVGAIAFRNMDDQVPRLERIYNKMGDEVYNIRHFYWKIRIMTGPEALRLRKRIRDDIGIENLL